VGSAFAGALLGGGAVALSAVASVATAVGTGVASLAVPGGGAAAAADGGATASAAAGAPLRRALIVVNAQQGFLDLAGAVFGEVGREACERKVMSLIMLPALGFDDVVAVGSARAPNHELFASANPVKGFAAALAARGVDTDRIAAASPRGSGSSRSGRGGTAASASAENHGGGGGDEDEGEAAGAEAVSRPVAARVMEDLLPEDVCAVGSVGANIVSSIARFAHHTVLHGLDPLEAVRGTNADYAAAADYYVNRVVALLTGAGPGTARSGGRAGRGPLRDVYVAGLQAGVDGGVLDIAATLQRQLAGANVSIVVDATHYIYPPDADIMVALRNAGIAFITADAILPKAELERRTAQVAARGSKFVLQRTAKVGKLAVSLARSTVGVAGRRLGETLVGGVETVTDGIGAGFDAMFGTGKAPEPPKVTFGTAADGSTAITIGTGAGSTVVHLPSAATAAAAAAAAATATPADASVTTGAPAEGTPPLPVAPSQRPLPPGAPPSRPLPAAGLPGAPPPATPAAGLAPAPPTTASRPQLMVPPTSSEAGAAARAAAASATATIASAMPGVKAALAAAAPPPLPPPPPPPPAPPRPQPPAVLNRGVLRMPEAVRWTEAHDAVVAMDAAQLRAAVAATPSLLAQPAVGGVTPLLLAASNNYRGMVHALLHAVAGLDVVGTAEELEAHAGDVAALVAATDAQDGMSALMWAAAHGNAHMFGELLDACPRDAHRDLLAAANKYGHTALCFLAAAPAARRAGFGGEKLWHVVEDARRARAVARAGALQPGAAALTSASDTAVAAATFRKYNAAAAMAARARAAVADDTAYAVLLAQPGAVDRWSALHFGAQSGALPYLALDALATPAVAIVRRGLRFRNRDAATPLHLAAWGGAPAATAALLALGGASALLEDSLPVGARLATALDLAVAGGHVHTSRVLLAAGGTCETAVGAAGVQQLLYRLLLLGDGRSVDRLLRDGASGAVVDAHLTQLLQRVGQTDACTFGMTRWSKPLTQWMYECAVCRHRVCAWCRDHCHTAHAFPVAVSPPPPAASGGGGAGASGEGAEGAVCSRHVLVREVFVKGVCSCAAKHLPAHPAEVEDPVERVAMQWQPAPVEVGDVPLPLTDAAVATVVEVAADAHHDTWRAWKEQQGWKEGRVYDEVAMTRPDLGPWASLPAKSQAASRVELTSWLRYVAASAPAHGLLVTDSPAAAAAAAAAAGAAGGERRRRGTVLPTGTPRTKDRDKDKDKEGAAEEGELTASEMAPLLEALARWQHETWCAGKLAAGWRYAREANKARLTSPLLVPFHLLPEYVQEENNRRGAAGFLDVLVAFGVLSRGGAPAPAPTPAPIALIPAGGSGGHGAGSLPPGVAMLAPGGGGGGSADHGGAAAAAAAASAAANEAIAAAMEARREQRTTFKVGVLKAALFATVTQPGVTDRALDHLLSSVRALLADAGLASEASVFQLFDERGSLLHQAVAAPRGGVVPDILHRCSAARNLPAVLAAANVYGMAPLAMAAAAGSLDVCRRLVAYGANVGAVDALGCTAAHYAAGAGQTAVLEFLRSAGENVAVVTALRHTKSALSLTSLASTTGKSGRRLDSSSGKGGGVRRQRSAAMLPSTAAAGAPTRSADMSPSQPLSSVATVRAVGAAAAVLRAAAGEVAGSAGMEESREEGDAGDDVGAGVALSATVPATAAARPRPSPSPPAIAPGSPVASSSAATLFAVPPLALDGNGDSLRPPLLHGSGGSGGYPATAAPSLLTVAVWGRQASAVEFLLQYGDDPTVADASGVTPYDRALLQHQLARKTVDVLADELASFGASRRRAKVRQHRTEAVHEVAAAAKARAYSRWHQAGGEGGGGTGGGDDDSGSGGTQRKAAAAVAVAAAVGESGGEEEGGRGDEALVDTLQLSTAIQVARKEAAACDAVLDAMHKAPAVTRFRQRYAFRSLLTRFATFLALFATFIVFTPAATDYNAGALNALTLSLKSAFTASYTDSVTSMDGWAAWMATNVLWPDDSGGGEGAVFTPLTVALASSTTPAGGPWDGGLGARRRLGSGGTNNVSPALSLADAAGRKSLYPGDGWGTQARVLSAGDTSLTGMAVYDAPVVGALRVRRLTRSGVTCGVPPAAGTLPVTCWEVDTPAPLPYFGIFLPGVVLQQADFESGTEEGAAVVDLNAGSAASRASAAEGAFLLSNDSDAGGWLTPATRSTVLGFTVYDPATTAFAAVRLYSYFPLNGGAVNMMDVRIMRPFHGRFPPSVGFQVLVAAAAVASVVGVARQVAAGGLWAALTSMRGVSDAAIAALFAVILGTDVWAGVAVRQRAVDASAAGSFVGVWQLAGVLRAENDLLAIVFYVSVARLAKHFRLVPGWGPLLMAMRLTLVDPAVLLFVAVILGITFAISVAYHVALASESFYFGSLLQSFHSLYGWTFAQQMQVFSDATPRPMVTFMLIVWSIVAVLLSNLLIGVVSNAYFERASRAGQLAWETLITQLLQRAAWKRYEVAAVSGSSRSWRTAAARAAAAVV